MKLKMIKEILLSSAILASPLVGEISGKVDKKLEQIVVLENQNFDLHGFNILQMIQDSRFKFHSNIDIYFKKSPERVIKNLEEYKKLIGFDLKVKKLKKFMAEYGAFLEVSEEHYRVPKEITSAIIGIESNFGEYVGKYNPFNVYVSMYLKNYRKKFARNELENLFEFCRRENLDPLALKSSYAGAMGYGQFIPSSVNSFFVGKNLWKMENNIMSVANYLNCHKEDGDSWKDAIWDYNHSRLYVGAVMNLARAGGFEK